MKITFSFLAAFTYFISVANKEFNTPKKNEITFAENKGQVSDQNYKPRPDVLFSGSINGMVYNLKNNGISYQLYKVESWREDKIDSKKAEETIRVPDKTTIYRLDINWLNTNNHVIVKKAGEQEGYNNYYLESCPDGATNVKSYSDIMYKNIYNGIDLHYYGKDGSLKYDYIVSPHSDYKKIQLEIKGAESIAIKNGELIIKTPLAEISEEAPLVFQNGKRIPAKWVLKNNIVSFEIEKYNPALPLIIDPAVRVWGTYYSGGSAEFGFTTTTDQSGNVYMGGNTGSNTTTLIATSGAHQTTYGGPSWDGFLVKFNTNGVRQWGTYYGGFGTEYIYGSVVDQSGNIYVAGSTQSTGPSIATVGSHQPNVGGGATDAYLAKFNTNGVRQWGTYYGGVGDETGYSCAVDPSGNVYLAGVTSTSVGTSITTVGSHQSSFGGNLYDGFLAKFNSAGTRLWGTYYGANQQEYAYNCCTDQLGNVYITGEAGTSSGTEIATLGSHQSTFGGSSLDGYLVKFNSSGIRKWGTYYGGTGGDRGYDCAAYGGFVYLAGVTTTSVSSVIATASAHQPNYGGGGGNNAYLVQFDTNGVRQWGTYYGGFITGEIAYSCAVDAHGNPYLLGQTSCTASIGVIETPGAHQTTYGGSFADAFLVGFTKSSGTRISGTYYGGTGYENPKDCATDLFGNIYFTGYTNTNTGTVIATPGSYQASSANGSNYSAWLTKFYECNGVPSAPVNTTPPANLVLCEGLTTTLSVSGTGITNWYASQSSSVVLATGGNYITPTLTAGTYTYYVDASTCTVSLTRTPITVTVNPLPIVTAGNSSVAVCNFNTGCLNANGASSYVWVGPCGFNSVAQSPCFPFSLACGCTYSVTGTDINGCKNTATVCINVVANPTVTVVSSGTLICDGQTATLTAGGANTYSWSTSATGSTTVVSPTATTNYSVTGTDLNGCINSVSITQSVSTCAGFNEQLIYNSQINIYPNPNNGEFLITLENTNQKNRIEIYNNIGELILEKELTNLTNEININRLSNGIYLLKIVGDGKLIKAEKIIKSQ
jgi:hypothetical protein